MDSIQSILPLLQLVTSGVGLGGNILNSVQQGKVASQAEKNANLTPQQLSTEVNQATQPLSAGLVQAINNQVQGDMAQRGLAEAPGIFATGEAQALAPAELQEQQTALNLILAKLGLPNQTLEALRSGGGGYANLIPLLTQMLKGTGTGTPNVTGGVPPTNPAGTNAGASLIQSWNAPPAPTGIDLGSDLS